MTSDSTLSGHAQNAPRPEDLMQSYGEQLQLAFQIPIGLPRMSDTACYVGVEKLELPGYFPEA